MQPAPCRARTLCTKVRAAQLHLIRKLLTPTDRTVYLMKRFAPALALIVGAAIALTATVAASPSYATVSPRTLPAGQTMFALSYLGDVPDLHSVDAATAVSTQVGTGITTPRFSSGQPAWDTVTRPHTFSTGLQTTASQQ